MTRRILLDTNVLAEPLKPDPAPNVLKKLKQHEEQISTATIVLHEMLYGVEKLPKSKRRELLEEYILRVVSQSLVLFPYDDRAAKWHAHEREILEKKGIMTSFADGQISAIAKTNDLILVTRNIADFKNFHGLAIENWFSP